MKQKKYLVLLQIIFSFIFLCLGIFSIFGIEVFIPVSVFSSLFLEVMILLIGIFFIREGVNNRDSEHRVVHLIIGLVLFFVAIFPIFVLLGVLKFLPYYIKLEVSPLVLGIVLFFAGLYMFLDRLSLLTS